MGEMADYALEQIANADEVYDRALENYAIGMADDTDMEALFDYDGTIKPRPISFRKSYMPIPTKQKTAHTTNKPIPTKQRTKSSLSLPEKPNVPATSMTGFVWLFYGAKGVGKSSLAAMFPNAIVFMFELYRRNLPILQVPKKGEPPLTVDTAFAYRDTILKLPASKRPKVVVVDTIDRFYKLLLNEQKSGRSDMKPNEWDEIDDRLEDFVSSFVENDICVVFISHSKARAETSDTASAADTEYAMTQPTCTPRCFKFLKQVVDFGFYYGYNGRDRTISIRGHQHLWAACGADHVFNSKKGEPIVEIIAGANAKETYKRLELGFNCKLPDEFAYYAADLAQPDDNDEQEED